MNIQKTHIVRVILILKVVALILLALAISSVWVTWHPSLSLLLLAGFFVAAFWLLGTAIKAHGKLVRYAEEGGGAGAAANDHQRPVGALDRLDRRADFRGPCSTGWVTGRAVL
jgi:hypothetical protein